MVAQEIVIVSHIDDGFCMGVTQHWIMLLHKYTVLNVIVVVTKSVCDRYLPWYN